MLHADNAYAGSQSFYRMEEALRNVFGTHYVLPVPLGRAAENIISQVFIKEGDLISMNYHFTTTQRTHGVEWWESFGDIHRGSTENQK